MGIFENENYKVISDFIESKSHILGENRELIEFIYYYQKRSKN